MAFTFFTPVSTPVPFSFQLTDQVFPGFFKPVSKTSLYWSGKSFVRLLTDKLQGTSSLLPS